MTAPTAAVWVCRAMQVFLGLLAVVFVVGGAQMNVLAFAALGVFALVLLAFAGLLEVVAVGPIRRRWGETDGP